MTMTFRGSADATPMRCVTVHESGRVLRTLQLRLDLCNHSPTGFGWGYLGQGPAQLALAILAEATGDDATALRLHQQFKEDQVATLPMDRDWEIAREDVLSWVADQPPQRARKASSTGAMVCLALGLGLALAGPARADVTTQAMTAKLQTALLEAGELECEAKTNRYARDMHVDQFGRNGAAELRSGFMARCSVTNSDIIRTLIDFVDMKRIDVHRVLACMPADVAKIYSDDWRDPGMASKLFNCAHPS